MRRGLLSAQKVILLDTPQPLKDPLRHTWVTRLLVRNVAPYKMWKWAEHNSTAFTESTYARWLPGDVHREEIKRLQSSPIEDCDSE